MIRFAVDNVWRYCGETVERLGTEAHAASRRHFLSPPCPQVFRGNGLATRPFQLIHSPYYYSFILFLNEIIQS